MSRYYEPKTPLVLESIAVFRSVIKGLQDGSLEPNVARTVISAARGLQSAIPVDLKARQIGPKLDAQEALQIEHSAEKELLPAAAE
jgi:hypothetical protein